MEKKTYEEQLAEVALLKDTVAKVVQNLGKDAVDFDYYEARADDLCTDDGNMYLATGLKISEFKDYLKSLKEGD